MMELVLAVLGFFPVSFLIFVLSERVNVTHQARVGRGILFGQYFYQHWVDMIADLRLMPSRRDVILCLSQLLLVLLLFVSVDCAFYLYLLLNWFLMVASTRDSLGAVERIDLDRLQMRFLLGAIVSFICILGVGLSHGSLNLALLEWDWTHLFFILPFQVSGMVLFGEHPFTPANPRTHWLESSRFFVWSLLSAKIFLGGSWFVFDFYVKAAALYLISRLIGQYFPRYAQADLFRIMIVYFIPVVSFLFLLSAVIHV